MAIDFSPTDAQKQLRKEVREFANNVLAPVVPQADAEPDPQRGFALTKEAYKEAYRSGIAMCMIPKEYGGLGFSATNYGYYFLRSAGAADFIGLVPGVTGPRLLAALLFGYAFAAKVGCGLASEIGSMLGA